MSGSSSVISKQLRDKAIQFICGALDAAAELGADKVTCCPLSDGYDYLFQVNYQEAWNNMVSTFKEGASHRKDIRLFLEYKASEPRVQCFLDSAAKTMCMIRDIDEPNLGMTMDVGHALIVGETPAESLCLAHSAGIPYYIHINDNDGKWDWDYFCGTKHFLEYFEFLYYLKKLGYDDYLTSDTSPTRWNIKGTFEVNSRISNKIWQRLDEIDMTEFERLIAGDDYLKTWQFIENNIFALK